MKHTRVHEKHTIMQIKLLIRCVCLSDMLSGLIALPRLDLVLERSMMVCLLGLLRTERLAREISAVTRVIDILEHRTHYPW